MIASAILLGTLLAAQSAPPGSAENRLYDSLRSAGATFAGRRVEFPPPLLADGASADDERRALSKLTGSDRAYAEFVRDSVSAPFILKTRDERAGDAGIVRIADVWFVVRASLDDLDPAALDPSTADGKAVEAGNMRFSASTIDAPALAALGIKPATGKDRREWFVHFNGRLLDRIAFEATDQVVATKSAASWVVAARTDPRFDDDKTAPNRWHAIHRQGSKETAGPDEAYPGGASYVRISRLAGVEGALLVEIHAAFFEPKAWFDGAPVLRSKIGVVAQDRIRGLRRELAKAKSRTTTEGRSSSSVPGR